MGIGRRLRSASRGAGRRGGVVAKHRVTSSAQRSGDRPGSWPVADRGAGGPARRALRTRAPACGSKRARRSGVLAHDVAQELPGASSALRWRHYDPTSAPTRQALGGEVVQHPCRREDDKDGRGQARSRASVDATLRPGRLVLLVGTAIVVVVIIVGLDRIRGNFWPTRNSEQATLAGEHQERSPA